MQAIVETLFDTVYLFSVITIGILMIRKSKGNRQFTMFGIMAVLLGSGDAFHLVPRATARMLTAVHPFSLISSLLAANMSSFEVARWFTNSLLFNVMLFSYFIK